MESKKIQELIEKRISENPKSKSYTATSFNDLGNMYAVHKALSRLAGSSKLVRAARGIYKQTEYSNFLREELAANPEEIAKAYAEAYGWTIAPYGGTALNLLGLSTQVPNVFQYVSSGPYRTIKLYDGREIKFRHKTIREISGLSSDTAMLLEAFSNLGKEGVTQNVKKAITRKFSKTELGRIKNEASKCRRWIYNEICELAVAHDV